MRLTHIFWSLLVLAVMILLPRLLFLNHGKLQGGPEIFGSYLVLWWTIDAVSPLALVIAKARRMPLREKFFFTLLATLNLYFGLIGIYYLNAQAVTQIYRVSFVLCLLNLVWTGIIAYYQLRPKAINHSDA